MGWQSGVMCQVFDMDMAWGPCVAGEMATLTTSMIGCKKPGVVGCISGAWCPFLLAYPCPQGISACAGPRTGQESQLHGSLVGTQRTKHLSRRERTGGMGKHDVGLKTLEAIRLSLAGSL